MLNTVHVVTAAAIVVTIPDPRLSLPLALASHLIFDTIPHWNWSPGKTTKGQLASIADGVAAFAIIIFFAWQLQSWIMVAAGILSMLPDIIQAPYHFLGWKPSWLSAFIEWERKRQKWPWMKPWMGIATQIATLAIALAIVFAVAS